MPRTPRPFIIQRDGTLMDRASGAICGRVHLTEGGWVGENLKYEFAPVGTRWLAGRQAWKSWKDKE